MTTTTIETAIENIERIELRAHVRDIAACKKIERRLFDSEQRYRSLFDASPHPMWVYDRRTFSFLVVNEAAIQSYGYSAAEFHSMIVTDIECPNQTTVENTRRTRRLQHLKKNGSVMEVEVSSLPVVFDGRETELVTATDVTARVRAESERQVILDIIQSVNLTTNLDELLRSIHRALGTILYAENCFVALHDPVTNFIQFAYWVDKLDPRPAPRPLGEGFTSYVLQNGEPLSLTGEFKQGMYASGTVKKIGTSSASWLGVPLRTPSRIIGILAVQHYENENVYSQADIDFLSSVGGQIALAIERKRSEQALLEANQRAISDYEVLLRRLTTLAESFGTARDLPTICRVLYAFAVTSAPADRMLIWSYDAQRDEHSLTYARAGTNELVLPLPAVICKCLSSHSHSFKSGEVVVEHEGPGAHTPVCRSVAGGEFSASKFSLITPMIMKGVVTGAVEIQSQGTISFAQSDVTAMQMAANLAAQAIENVCLLVSDRDKEELLRQAQKMEAVGQLAGGVAHDFNNLLTAINGHAEIALRRMDPEAPLRKHLNEIKKAGDRAVSLTRQLMTFSRKQALETSIFNLNGVVSDMQMLMRRLIGEDIELVASLEPSLGYVKADASQIESLLMNLVVNARDALIGGGRITIETANVSLDDSYTRKHGLHGAGPYVMLAVSDTGIGMDAATQSRIFEPFFTTKEHGKGTGLGLSIVYGGVKQNGGHLSVESELGSGTSFKIYLPQVEQTAIATEPETVLAEPGTETILLVEDEQMVRKLARHILETSGYTVVEAGNGKEAIECCKSLTRPPSLLLTDVVMPEMSGPALVEEMTKLYPDIGLLYMSGYNDLLGAYGIATQGSPFLQKPFSPDGLATKVREVLDGKAEIVK